MLGKRKKAGSRQCRAPCILRVVPSSLEGRATKKLRKLKTTPSSFYYYYYKLLVLVETKQILHQHTMCELIQIYRK